MNFVFLKVFVSLLATISIVSNAYANLLPKELKFQHVLKNHEMVLGEVRVVYQDKRGVIWLGGWNQLVRYDGYELIPVPATITVEGETRLVPTTETITLFQDGKGTMWVGTARGLYRHDPVKNLLTPVAANEGQAVDISDVLISGIKEADTGELIIATRGGLVVLDPEALEYESYVFNIAEPSSVKAPSSLGVECVHQDPSGEFWLCTHVGIDKYDHATRTFHRIVPDPTTEFKQGNQIQDIESDGDGALWLASPRGVLSYNVDNGDVKRYRYQANGMDELTSYNIWDLLVDKAGRLWIAAEGAGVYLYDPEQDDFRNYRPDTAKPTSLGGLGPRSLFEDDNGDLWIGFYPEGVDFFDQSSTAVTAYTEDPADPTAISKNSVLSISEDMVGNLWLGTDGGGVSFFDREKQEFTSYQFDQHDTNSPASDAVLTTFLDSDGILWMGHWAAGLWPGGVTRMDPKTKTFTRLPVADDNSSEAARISDSLNSPHVWSIFEDSNKELWLGTHDGGLVKYDRESKLFKHYEPDANDPNSISSDWIWFTYEDSNKNFWVGTHDGLNLMDREKETFEKFRHHPEDPTSLAGTSALNMHEDAKGRLWVGTAYGLSLFDQESKTFSHVTTADGLFNDNIRSIVEDKKGNLWLATSNGISFYNPDSGKIKNYTRDGGILVGGFNIDAGILSKKGDIIFGGANGLRAYEIDKLADNKKIPPIAFTNLKIYSEVVKVGGEDGVLQQDIDFTDKIVLDYTKGMFEIDFVALNYRDSNKNEYAYKLEGFDDRWHYVGGKRSAKYTNLDTGTYTFRVKASNNDGVWNEVGRSITIVQLPPWWLTWWAYMIYCLIGLGMILLIALQQQRKRKRLEALNTFLEQKVAEQTFELTKRASELSKKNDDIQFILSNMHQGLFTVDATEKIDAEYSKHLEIIYETEEIGHRNYLEFLFSHSNMAKDSLEQVRAASRAILGESVFGYNFNSHLLCSEYDIKMNGCIKHLSLEWKPIVVEDIVNKIMVTVRDVTELKEAENQALAQKRELDIITQLVYLEEDKFNSFAASVKKYIQENRNIVSSKETSNSASLATMFRNMHTIKGNARTFGLSFIAENAHAIESVYSEIQNGTLTNWDSNKLLEDLNTLNQVLDEYSDVFFRVLGRSKESLKSRGKNASSSRLENVLADVVRAVPSIASQLNKESPEINIDSGDVLINGSANDLLNSIFSHILRNAIDHGIELPKQRVEKGKPSTGRIDISSRVVSGNLEIAVEDDGQGLNLEKLLEIGKKANKWKDKPNPTPSEIAQLIFESGVSTSDSVTDISGRGVGMDAVKQYIIERGGDVMAVLLDNESKESKFTRFKTLITLPKSYFRVKKFSAQEGQEGA